MRIEKWKNFKHFNLINQFEQQVKGILVFSSFFRFLWSFFSIDSHCSYHFMSFLRSLFPQRTTYTAARYLMIIDVVPLHELFEMQISWLSLVYKGVCKCFCLKHLFAAIFSNIFWLTRKWSSFYLKTMQTVHLHLNFRFSLDFVLWLSKTI